MGRDIYEREREDEGQGVRGERERVWGERRGREERCCVLGHCVKLK